MLKKAEDLQKVIKEIAEVSNLVVKEQVKICRTYEVVASHLSIDSIFSENILSMI